MAKSSMQQIIEHGEVKRGQIGVGIQDITPDLRKAFEIENGQGGVLITDVMEDSPAEDAGLKSGDLIIAVDGKNTTSTGQLRSQIGIREIGESVTLTLLRDGDEMRTKVKVGKRNAEVSLNGKMHDLFEGIQFENAPQGRGVRIVSIAANSRAAHSGLRAGDIIVAANKRRVQNLESLESALSANKSSILLQINRRGGSFFIVIR
jgi:S1-C subfamily serine protease